MNLKFFRKIIPLFLCIILLSSLASCSSSKIDLLDNNTPVEISLWHYYKGSQMKILEKQINRFNETVGKEKKIIVTGLSMRSSQDIYDQMILSANNEPASQELPNMAMMYPDAAYKLNNLNILTSYNKYLTDEIINRYIPSFINEGKITNTDDIFVFPISKSSEVLYINNTAYQRFLTEYNNKYPNNILTENMLSTFEGLQDTAKAYYEYTNGKSLFGFDSPCNFAIAGFNQLDDNFFIEDKNKEMTINLDSPTFKNIWDNYYAPMVKGYYASYSFYRAEDIQTGDILMYIGSTGGASFFPTTVTYSDNTKEDIQLKVKPFPTFSGGKKSAVQQGAGIALCKTTEQEQHASTIFLTWLTKEDNNAEFILDSGYLPVTKKAFKETLPSKLNSNNETIQKSNIAKVISLTAKNYEDMGFYTYKPFNHSEDIRFYFEDMILEKANSAHDDFTQYIENGHTFNEAIDVFLSNNAYNEFIIEVKNELSKIKSD